MAKRTIITDEVSPATLLPGDRIMHEGNVRTVVQVVARSAKRNGTVRTIRGYWVDVATADTGKSTLDERIPFKATDKAVQVRRKTQPAKIKTDANGTARDEHGVPVYKSLDEMPPRIRAGFNRYYNRNEEIEMAATTRKSTTKRKPTATDSKAKTAKPRAARTTDVSALASAHGEAIGKMLAEGKKWPEIQSTLNLTYAQAWLANARHKNSKLVVASAKVTPAWVKEQREQHNRSWGLLTAISNTPEDKLRALYREAGASDKGDHVRTRRSADKPARSTSTRKTAAKASTKAAAPPKASKGTTGTTTAPKPASGTRSRRSGVKTTK